MCVSNAELVRLIKEANDSAEKVMESMSRLENAVKGRTDERKRKQ